MTRTNKKQNAVDAVFKPNDQGVSEWITRETFDSNPVLNWGRNGNGRRGIYFGDSRHIWDVQRNKGTITHLRTTGFSDNKLYGAERPISKNKRLVIIKDPCCNCGSCTNVEVDHKNDMYNDPRVLNTATQRLDDFQPLCRKCNLDKRECNKKTRSSGRRQGPPAAILELCDVKFTEGDDTYDENDVNWHVGTYWGDVKAFLAKAKRMEKDRIRKEVREKIIEEFIEAREEIIEVLSWPIFRRRGSSRQATL